MHKHLVEFEQASPYVQAAFWKALGREVARRNEIETRIDIPAGPWCGPSTCWDIGWQKRARNQKQEDEQEVFEIQRERLKEILSSDYVEALTGAEPGRLGKFLCPLHEERTPSFNVRGVRWHCFGCGATGDIYELASRLWGIPMKGAAFFQLHKRLLELYP